MNIRTLGDLTRVTEQQLLSSKNFGETSLNEIKEMMTSKGLRLGQSLEEGAQADTRFRPQQPLSEQEQAVLNRPVSDLNLSVRARKCMNRLGINTLGDLTRVTEAQLLASKNFGETSLGEINEIMRAKGLRLGQSLEQGAQYERRFPQQQLSAEEQAVMNKPVSELNLSVRARKCMNRLGINTLGERVTRTADELLEAKNFGMTSLTEVRERLGQYNLKLRGD